MVRAPVGISPVCARAGRAVLWVLLGLAQDGEGGAGGPGARHLILACVPGSARVLHREVCPYACVCESVCVRTCVRVQERAHVRGEGGPSASAKSH